MEEPQNNQAYQSPNPPRPTVTQPSQPIMQEPVIQAPVAHTEPPPTAQPPQQQTTPIAEPVTSAIEETQNIPTYQSGNLQATEGYEQQNVGVVTETKKGGDTVSWSAAEFVLHEKTSGWHLLVGIGSVVLALIIYFLTKSIFGAVTVVIVGIMISIFGNLKPRTLDYIVSPEGIQIGDKHYDYLLFRSFAVIEASGHPSLQLIPQKRFAVPISIYFSPNDGDHIVDILGEYLPFEHQERDVVDKLSARLRF